MAASPGAQDGWPTPPQTDWVRELVRIMAQLRAPGGCPWDQEQDHRSLRPYLIEECYEVIDALEAGDDAAFAEELGDLLLQVVFHCQLANEERRFDLQTAARLCCEKLVRRHPHVFGDSQARDSEAVLRQWERIKQTEKGPATGPPPGTLSGVPRHLPALSQAAKLQKKAARVGFDWPDINGVLDKVAEELAEIRQALADGDAEHARRELGDLLFAASNLARHLKADPELELRAASTRFTQRFVHMEASAASRGQALAALTLAEWETLWGQAKQALAASESSANAKN